MWEQIIKFKNAIIAIIFISTITLSATAYFVKASDFKKFKNEFYDYKAYQRLEYLDRRILQLEMTYNCIATKCMPPKMSIPMYETYDETLKERLRLQEKLNLNKQEDQAP